MMALVSFLCSAENICKYIIKGQCVKYEISVSQSKSYKEEGDVCLFTAAVEKMAEQYGDLHVGIKVSL